MRPSPDRGCVPGIWRGVPVIAWITPSDGTNLRLKSHSALCRGAKRFFFRTYGPTATGIGNCWSDLRGAYDGVVRVARQLAAAEEVLLPARLRPARVVFFNAWARVSGASPQVGILHPVVEAGVYESPKGVVLVLANFTYEPIEKLQVRLPVRADVKRIHAADAPDRAIPFETLPADEAQRQEGFTGVAAFEIPLGLDQIVIVR